MKILRTWDGKVPWPPRVVAMTRYGGCWYYYAYPGKINGVALGWVGINLKRFDQALKMSATLKP